jgi:zona occludens toxin (predicted ATPase)
VALYLVEGPPGSGKTYFTTRKIDAALAAGKVVVTNVSLRPDWVERVAKGSAWCWTSRGARRKARRANYSGRLLELDQLEDLFRVRVDGTEEGRWVVVLDEGQRWLNSRTWSKEDREQIVRWFTAHRHYGADVYLIAQDVEMLDKQVRVLFEERITLRNLRNFKVMGVRILPGNFFVAIHRWNSTEKHILKRETYRLSRRVARLYNTHQLAEDDDQAHDVIRLPRTDGPAARPAAA